MTITATRRMTAEEFYDWVNSPENAGRHYELERGEVVEVSRPGEKHGVVRVNTGYLLSGYSRQRRQGYVCANDTGIVWERDPDVVRGPDLIYYALSRRFDELNPKFAEDVPLLAVEVVSPNDRPGRISLRVEQFLGWGVAMVWVVDPESSIVTVYRADRRPQVFTAGQDLVAEDLLPGFRCRVTDFFFMPGEEAAPSA